VAVWSDGLPNKSKRRDLSMQFTKRLLVPVLVLVIGALASSPASGQVTVSVGGYGGYYRPVSHGYYYPNAYYYPRYYTPAYASYYYPRYYTSSYYYPRYYYPTYTSYPSYNYYPRVVRSYRRRW
jgi:hypothetical protein